MNLHLARRVVADLHSIGIEAEVYEDYAPGYGRTTTAITSPEASALDLAFQVGYCVREAMADADEGREIDGDFDPHHYTMTDLQADSLGLHTLIY